MGIIRDVEQLEPNTRALVKAALAALTAAGIAFYINETLRTSEVQDAYFAQGREPLEDVNAKRKAAGLWLIGAEENAKPITWTHESFHLLGKAIDVVPALPSGGPNWNASLSVFKDFSAAFKAQGMVWGGDWVPPKQDLPHYQMGQS